MNRKYYKTKDLNLASAILSKGILLSDYLKDESGAVTFSFSDLKGCSRIEKMWLTNKLEVSAYDYAAALRRLKSVIHGTTSGMSSVKKL